MLRCMAEKSGEKEILECFEYIIILPKSLRPVINFFNKLIEDGHMYSFQLFYST